MQVSIACSFHVFLCHLCSHPTESFGGHLQEGGYVVEGGSADDLRVFAQGADVAFLGCLESDGVGFALGDDEAALVETEDELAKFEGVAGDGVHAVVGDAIDEAWLNHGGDNFGGLAQEETFDADDHVAFVADVFGHGGAVLGVVLQHHATFHVVHVVAHFTFGYEFVSSEHFEGHEDVGEGVQCLHTQVDVVTAADFPCHFASFVVQVHNQEFGIRS